jgi:hypothetical protein
MIDYEHIPPHLRLSDRHLIVPDYPGGAAWWAMECFVPKKHGKRKGRTEEQKRRRNELARKRCRDRWATEFVRA